MKLFYETVKLGVENVEIQSLLVRSFLIRIAIDGLSSILKDLARLFQNILQVKGWIGSSVKIEIPEYGRWSN